MKTILAFALSLSLTLQVHAQAGVPSAEIQSYWQWTQEQNQDSESVDQCLEKIYGNSEDLQICEQAVSDLTQFSLNPHRREILISMLQKIPAQLQTKMQTELLKTLSSVRPETRSLIPSNEVRAWQKVLAKKVALKDAWVSLNGQPLQEAESFQAPQGTCQWTLLAPGLEPVVVTGTWNDFSLQLKNLKAQNKNWLPSQAAKAPAEQLGDLPSPAEESTDKATTSHTWIWVTALAVGAGVAAAFALKDKNVSVTMPGQH